MSGQRLTADSLAALDSRKKERTEQDLIDLLSNEGNPNNQDAILDAAAEAAVAEGGEKSGENQKDLEENKSKAAEPRAERHEKKPEQPVEGASVKTASGETKEKG